MRRPLIAVVPCLFIALASIGCAGGSPGDRFAGEWRADRDSIAASYRARFMEVVEKTRQSAQRLKAERGSPTVEDAADPEAQALKAWASDTYEKIEGGESEGTPLEGFEHIDLTLFLRPDATFTLRYSDTRRDLSYERAASGDWRWKDARLVLDAVQDVETLKHARITRGDPVPHSWTAYLRPDGERIVLEDSELRLGRERLRNIVFRRAEGAATGE